jgi:hypothetical protein
VMIIDSMHAVDRDARRASALDRGRRALDLRLSFDRARRGSIPYSKPQRPR